VAEYTQAQLIAEAKKAAEIKGVPPDLLIAMLTQENSWRYGGAGDHYVTLKDGSRHLISGIAQFMDTTAQDLGIDPNDPIQSIYGAATYMRQLASMFNNGQVPAASDKDRWIAAALSYNSGPGSVSAAIKGQRAFNGKTDWNQILKNLQQINGTDEGTRYYKAVTGQDTATDPNSSPADLARQSSLNTPKTGTGMSTVTGSMLQPPSITDFQTPDENGNMVTDSAKYYAAWNDYMKTQQTINDLQNGPLKQHFDDVISEMQQEIEAGKLSVSAADTIARNRISSFKNAMDAYASDAFKYGAPAGSKYVPGWEPGGFYNSKLGLGPWSAQTATVDPLAEAMATYSDTKSQLADLNIPHPTGMAPPDYTAYNPNAGVSAGSGAPPSGGGTSPQPSDNAIYNYGDPRLQDQRPPVGSTGVNPDGTPDFAVIGAPANGVYPPQPSSSPSADVISRNLTPTSPAGAHMMNTINSVTNGTNDVLAAAVNRLRHLI